MLAQIAALEHLTMSELRTRWCALAGKDAPPFNRALLIGRLAYRIQEAVYGGLKPATVERLNALVRQVERTGTGQGKGRRPHAATNRPVVGTRLIREWQGVEHCVTVRENGYEYEGRPFKSLSAVARSITGSRWNGWRFFGLRSFAGTDGPEATP